MNFTYGRASETHRCRKAALPLLAGIALGLAGCFGSSGQSEFEQYRERTTAFLDHVKELGGTAEKEEYNVAGRKGSAWTINLSGAEFSDDVGMELIQSLKPAGYIAAINFSDSSLTDEQLIQFDEDASSFVVMDLNLANTAVTDESIDKLEHFMALRNVDLTGTNVTQAAVDRWMERRGQKPNIPPMFRNPEIKM